MLDLMRKHLEALQSGDWSAYREAFTDDAEYLEVATQRRANGPEAITNLVKSWKEAFPDLSAEIESSSEVDDKAFAELAWGGTHDGKLETPFGALEATGKTANVSAALVYEVRDGKIASMHHYFDVLTLLGQIGALERVRAHARPEQAAE